MAVALAAGCGGSPLPKTDNTSGPTPDPSTAVPQVCNENAWCSFAVARGADADTSKRPLLAWNVRRSSGWLPSTMIWRKSITSRFRVVKVFCVT